MSDSVQGYFAQWAGEARFNLADAVTPASQSYWRGKVDALEAVVAMLGFRPADWRSPPITPGSPGGGPAHEPIPCHQCDWVAEKFNDMRTAAYYFSSHVKDKHVTHAAPSALPVGGDGGKVPDSESVRPTPPTTPTCASWCGKAPAPEPSFGFSVRGRWFCTNACLDAERPLHPRTP